MNSKTTDPISRGPHIQVPYLSETTPFLLHQASRDVLSRILTTLLRHLTPRIIPRSSAGQLGQLISSYSYGPSAGYKWSYNML